jgi:hypothetical protein
MKEKKRLKKEVLNFPPPQNFREFKFLRKVVLDDYHFHLKNSPPKFF